MNVVINKGIAFVLLLIFVPVGLLVLGQLGGGTSSFWYGINNPNTTSPNVFGNATVQVISAPTLLESTVLPIGVAIGLFVIILLGMLKLTKYKK